MLKGNVRKAAGCVVLKNKSLLLLHRIDKDWYELPGGKGEEGESLEKTAEREAQEELGSPIRIVKKLGRTFFKSVELDLDYTWFLAELVNADLLKIGEPKNFDRIEYIPVSELRKHKLSTNMQNLAFEIEEGRITL